MMQNQPFKDRDIKITETVDITTVAKIPNQNIATNYNGVLELFIMAGFTLVGFRLIYLKSVRYLDRARPVKSNIFKRLARPNCKKCRFYNRHADLQCAVHPVRVSFTEAETCPDYWSRDRHKFLHR